LTGLPNTISRSQKRIGNSSWSRRKLVALIQGSLTWLGLWQGVWSIGVVYNDS